MREKTAKHVRAALEIYGFVTKEQLRAIALDRDVRGMPMLLRFHEGRYIFPAAGVERGIAESEAAGWCLRDVCIVASECDRLREHMSHSPLVEYTYRLQRSYSS